MKNQLWWLLPITAFLFFTPFSAEIDLIIERYFYKSKQFVTNPYTDFFYQFGIVPAQLIGAAALLTFLLSYVWKKGKPYRTEALYLILTLAIGAGFIVHTLLKDQWGRPRPKQVIEFGGAQAFRPYYSPNFTNQPEPSRSFPCGHCTMGFFFFAIGFLCLRKGHLSWGLASFAFALALGFALGVTRMAQGGHFLSDVLASAILMWLSAAAFDKLLLQSD